MGSFLEPHDFPASLRSSCLYPLKKRIFAKEAGREKEGGNVKGLLAKETFARDILCCSSCKIFVAEKHEKLGALTAELGKWWKVCYAAAVILFS